MTDTDPRAESDAGRTLADLLRGRRELPRLVAVFGRACRAVALAHARGVVYLSLIHI